MSLPANKMAARLSDKPVKEFNPQEVEPLLNKLMPKIFRYNNPADAVNVVANAIGNRLLAKLYILGCYIQTSQLQNAEYCFERISPSVVAESDESIQKYYKDQKGLLLCERATNEVQPAKQRALFEEAFELGEVSAGINLCYLEQAKKEPDNTVIRHLCRQTLVRLHEDFNVATVDREFGAIHMILAKCYDRVDPKNIVAQLSHLKLSAEYGNEQAKAAFLVLLDTYARALAAGAETRAATDTEDERKTAEESVQSGSDIAGIPDDVKTQQTASSTIDKIREDLRQRSEVIQLHEGATTIYFALQANGPVKTNKERIWLYHGCLHGLDKPESQLEKTKKLKA